MYVYQNSYQISVEFDMYVAIYILIVSKTKTSFISKSVLPYSTKHWRWKTLVNPTEDCIGEKNIGKCIPCK